MNETIQNLKTRRSCRKYRPEQLSRDELNTILEAGTYAPTGRGRQSPIIVVVQDPKKIRQIERLNSVVKGNPDAPAFYGAPTLLIVFGQTDVPFGVSDGNLVIGNLLNAAHAIGVDSCYIWRAKEVFETEEGKAIQASWNIPDNYAGVGNVILGYGAAGGTGEPRPRKEDYIRFV